MYPPSRLMAFVGYSRRVRLTSTNNPLDTPTPLKFSLLKVLGRAETYFDQFRSFSRSFGVRYTQEEEGCTAPKGVAVFSMSRLIVGKMSWLYSTAVLLLFYIGRGSAQPNGLHSLLCLRALHMHVCERLTRLCSDHRAADAIALPCN